MGQIANNSDFGSVSICFEEESINKLFAELVQVHGFRAQILGSVVNAPEETRIITEPQYFPLLSSALKKNCLLVGNKGSLEGMDVPVLTRPLTEEKVESAINHFLKID